jgi:hypothetical protein
MNMDSVTFRVNTSADYFVRWLHTLRPPIELAEGGALLLQQARWEGDDRVVISGAVAGSGYQTETATPPDLIALELKPLSPILLEMRATCLVARYLGAFLELLGRIADRWPKAAPAMLNDPLTADYIRAQKRRKSRRKGGRPPLTPEELAERAEWVAEVEEMSERRGISLKRACQLMGLGYATYRDWKRRISEAEKH